MVTTISSSSLSFARFSTCVCSTTFLIMMVLMSYNECCLVLAFQGIHLPQTAPHKYHQRLSFHPETRTRRRRRGRAVTNLYDENYEEEEQESPSPATSEFGAQRDAMYYSRAKHWIVIVDDEEAIRTAVGQYLYDNGYRVTACADADTAMQIASGRHPQQQQQQQQQLSSNSNEQKFKIPDAIVSDVRMPNIDGLQFLQMIRSDDALMGTPVVLLTAKGMTEDRIAGYKAGADAYLPKPFSPDELISILDASIARHEALNGGDESEQSFTMVEELQKDVNEIRDLLLNKGGGGVGNGWIKSNTNVFLTPDEQSVLDLLSEGGTNMEIAVGLDVTRRRVEQHLTSMFKKTGVSNRTELVRWAISTGNVEV